MLKYQKTIFSYILPSGLIFILLTGCNYWFHKEPDVKIEIDLTQQGKPGSKAIHVNDSLYRNIKVDSKRPLNETINEIAIKTAKSGAGNLKNALNLAVYLVGMERSNDVINPKKNSDLNVNNSDQGYKTPSYYVMKMFSENKPDNVLPAKITLNNRDIVDKNSTSIAKSKLYQGKEPVQPLFCATAGIHDKSGLVIIKIVNSLASTQNCRIFVNYKQIIKYKGEVMVLTSKNIMDENSFKEPEKVVPMTRELTGLKNTFNYECPANSIIIIKLRFKKGINGIGNCC